MNASARPIWWFDDDSHKYVAVSCELLSVVVEEILSDWDSHLFLEAGDYYSLDGINKIVLIK